MDYTLELIKVLEKGCRTARKINRKYGAESLEEQRFKAAFDAYLPKIRTFARRNVNHFAGWAVEDIVQEITVVLWKCLKTYDPNKAAGFSTFFWTAARNQMQNLIDTMSAQKRQSEWFVLASRTPDGFDLFEHLIDEQIQEASAEDWAMIHETVYEMWDELSEKSRRKLLAVS